MKTSKEFKQFLKNPQRECIEGVIGTLKGAKESCRATCEFVEDWWKIGKEDWFMDTFPCGITVTYSSDFFRS